MFGWFVLAQAVRPLELEVDVVHEVGYPEPSEVVVAD